MTIQPEPFDTALEKIAHLEEYTTVQLNAFERSLILALLYGIPKEDALEFILQIRRNDSTTKTQEV